MGAARLYIISVLDGEIQQIRELSLLQMEMHLCSATMHDVSGEQCSFGLAFRLRGGWL